MKILGIDVGGTGIKGAIVNTKKGTLKTDRYRIPTPQPATPDAVLDTVTQIVKEFDWKGPIGCGFPAAIRHEIIKTASNIDPSWKGLNAAERIQQATGCPTHLVNDADAAGLSEVKFGAGKDEKGVVMMITCGTGVGSGLFTNKKLVPNTEFGFIHVDNTKAEYYCSNTAREKENLDWEVWGGRLNKYLKRLEELFWPDLFIIGGGISKQFDSFSQYIELDTKVVPAESRNHAGIIGAALAAQQNISKKLLKSSK